MEIKWTETPRTTDLRQCLGPEKTSTSNTSTNSDVEMNNGVQQEPVTVDNETVVQGTMGENTQNKMKS